MGGALVPRSRRCLLRQGYGVPEEAGPTLLSQGREVPRASAAFCQEFPLQYHHQS